MEDANSLNAPNGGESECGISFGEIGVVSWIIDSVAAFKLLEDSGASVVGMEVEAVSSCTGRGSWRNPRFTTDVVAVEREFEATTERKEVA